jgi:circadian clock protein KaiC
MGGRSLLPARKREDSSTMSSRAKRPGGRLLSLKKCPTGIPGLDEISGGGLPKGRTTIVCGGPGCGKTMLGMEFLVRGALQFSEPGVLMAFEETPHDIATNVASLGFNIHELARKKKLYLDFLSVEPSEIRESGDYDLGGLFIRLESAIAAIGAKRVLFDTLEALFSGFRNPQILRAEFRRLIRWLKDRGLTAVVTAERGEGSLTRYGLEEYVSDCVILLDHRVKDQISERRLRIVKYRGTRHGADEYPFLIEERGMSILPLSALQLQHKVWNERVSSGIPDLDKMLEGKGYYRGTSVLVTGTAGSGKTSVAAAYVDAACRRGERCLYIDFEESRDQVARNMKSVGLDLNRWAKKGLLTHEAWRPTQFGIEMHLLRIHKLIEKHKPQCVVIDPISNLMHGSEDREVHSMMMRLMDFLKNSGITALFVSLTAAGGEQESTTVGISSLADTWILLRDIEMNGERNRCIYVLKSRGMAHSNQLREFVITSRGIQLIPPYIGLEGVLTGSARMSQEAKEKSAALQREIEISQKEQELSRKQLALQAQVASLQAELASVNREAHTGGRENKKRQQQAAEDRANLVKSRGANRVERDRL